MTAFTPQQENELAALTRRVTEPHAVLIRQLQDQDGLLHVLPSAGPLTVNGGTGSVSFTASSQSGATNIAHGLPGTPVSVIAVGIENGIGRFVLITVANVGPTTFDVAGYYTTGAAITNSSNFYWLAIG